MVKKVSANDVKTLVKSGCKVVAVPYCTAQTTLTRYGDRVGYHADVYGWRYDLIHFPETDIYIVTGYELPRVTGMIKPDRDTIKAVNEMDRNYNNGDAASVIFDNIMKQLLG